MPDDSGRLRSIDYRSAFPWIHIFRGFRIAIDFRKLLMAALALLALVVGDWGIALLPFGPSRPADGVAAFALAEVESVLITPPDLGARSPLERMLHPVRPWLAFVERGSALFREETTRTWAAVAYAWTRWLWLLIVSAVFGGAIVRMAAVQFARDEKLGLWPALRYATARFPSLLTAPLLPVLGIGILWALCALLGLAGRIPYAGGPALGALWFIPLALGLVMTLIVMGVAAGWPLMYAAIGAEDSDAFDGFSRSYSYVFGRPWHYLGMAIVAAIYGALVILFVAGAAQLVVHLSGAAVASGFGDRSLEGLFRREFALPGRPGPATPIVAAQFTAVWLWGVALIASGFAYSYFWTAATIIYFLLRRVDDGTELDEVRLGDDPEPDDLLPFVGVAASKQPVVERLPSGDATASSAEPLAAPIPTGDTEIDIRDVPPIAPED